MRLSRQVELMTSIRSAATAEHEESQHTVSAAHERVVQMQRALEDATDQLGLAEHKVMPRPD